MPGSTCSNRAALKPERQSGGGGSGRGIRPARGKLRYDLASCQRLGLRDFAATDQECADGLDQPLLQRIASGDISAVQACIDRYAGLVWSLTRRMSLNGADAEDAVQEIFVELWRNAFRFDPEVASETAFVAMIARRRLIDRRRRMARQRDRAPLEDVSPVGAESPAAERGEEVLVALRAIEELSAEQQRVLRLSLLQGLSHEKIASATGLPLGTVKTHARRGLLRIRELLGGLGASRQGVNP